MTNQISKRALGSQVDPSATIAFVCMKNTYHNAMSKQQRVEHTLGLWRISKENREEIAKDLESGLKVYVIGVARDEFGDYAIKTCFEIYRFHTEVDSEGVTRTIFHQVDELRYEQIGLKYVGGGFDRGFGTVKIVRQS